MKTQDIARMFRRVAAASKEREDWARAVRNFDAVVDGLPCNVHFRLQLQAHVGARGPLVEGECFVYLSWREGEVLIGGCGHLRFGATDAAIEQGPLLFEFALAEAKSQLFARPEVLARFERNAIERACAPSESAPIPRRRFSL